MKYEVTAFNEWINKEKTDINIELFKTHFKFWSPSSMAKELHKTNDKEKNIILVSVTNSVIKDLKEEINKMSEKDKSKSQIKY